jgi:hypothetical protein
MKSAVAAALILATATYGRAQTGRVQLPISVIARTYSHTQQSVQFTVLNDGDQTVTAWQVSLEAKGPDGARLQSKGWATDSYLSAAGVIPTGLHVEPKQTATTTVRFASTQGAIVTVEVTAAILSDGTAFGAARDVDYLFTLRERHYNTWTNILSVLREANRNDTGLTALQSAESGLVSALSHDKENPRLVNALQNIRIAIADAEQGRANPITRMESLIANTERQLAAAAGARRAPVLK